MKLQTTLFMKEERVLTKISFKAEFCNGNTLFDLPTLPCLVLLSCCNNLFIYSLIHLCCTPQMLQGSARVRAHARACAHSQNSGCDKAERKGFSQGEIRTQNTCPTVIR